MIHAQLSTGFIVGTIVAVLLLLILVGLRIFAGWYFSDEWKKTAYKGDVKAARWLKILNNALVGVVIASSAAAYFPWTAQYHVYKPVSGKIQAIGSRIISDGGKSVNQRFGVQIGNQLYGCDDTRCAELQAGEDVTLMCIRQWQWNANSGWVCNWGKRGLNTPTGR